MWEIVRGVIVGVTVAVCLGLYDQWRIHKEESDQKRFVQDVIQDGMDRIRLDRPTENLKELPADVIAALTPDSLRSASYVAMRQSLQSAFEQRSSRISYDERKQVFDALELIDDVLSNARQPVGMDLYNDTFDELRKVPWLRLDE